MACGEPVGYLGGYLDGCGVGAVGPAAGEECTAVYRFLGRWLGHFHVPFISDSCLHTCVLSYVGSGNRGFGSLYETDFFLRGGFFCPRFHTYGCPDGHRLFLGRKLYEHALDGRRRIHAAKLGLESEQQQDGMDRDGKQDACVCGFTVVHCVEVLCCLPASCRM